MVLSKSIGRSSSRYLGPVFLLHLRLPRLFPSFLTASLSRRSEPRERRLLGRGNGLNGASSRGVLQSHVKQRHLSSTSGLSNLGLPLAPFGTIWVLIKMLGVGHLTANSCLGINPYDYRSNRLPLVYKTIWNNVRPI
jgi:hypothetical protein